MMLYHQQLVNVDKTDKWTHCEDHIRCINYTRLLYNAINYDLLGFIMQVMWQSHCYSTLTTVKVPWKSKTHHYNGDNELQQNQISIAKYTKSSIDYRLHIFSSFSMY